MLASYWQGNNTYERQGYITGDTWFIVIYLPLYVINTTCDICIETDSILYLEVRQTYKVVKQHMNIWIDVFMLRGYIASCQ